MRILFIGEIVGSAGIYCVKALLPGLKRELGIDLTIASAEGATGGFGIGKGHAVYLHKLGVDVITAGDFAYFKRDAVSYFGQARFLLRPANYPYGNPGRGWLVARPRSEQSRPGSPARRAEPRRVAAAAPSATAATTEAAARAVAGAADAGAAGSPESPPAGPADRTSAQATGDTAEAAAGGAAEPAPAGAAGGTRAGGAEHIPAAAGAGASAAEAGAAPPEAGAAPPEAGAAPPEAGTADGSDTPAPAAPRARQAGAKRGGRAGRRPPASAPPAGAAGSSPVPGVGVISLLGQAGFSRVHLRSPFEMAGGLIERVKQQTPIVLVDFHATTTSEKVAMSLFLDGKVTALIGTHVRTLSADARILPGGTAAITHSGRTGSLNSVGGLDPEVETRMFLTQVHEQSRDAWGLLELQGAVLEVGPDGSALSIDTLRRQTTAPEAARKAAEAQRHRGPGRGRRTGGRR